MFRKKNKPTLTDRERESARAMLISLKESLEKRHPKLVECELFGADINTGDEYLYCESANRKSVHITVRVRAELRIDVLLDADLWLADLDLTDIGDSRLLDELIESAIVNGVLKRKQSRVNPQRPKKFIPTQRFILASGLPPQVIAAYEGTFEVVPSFYA